MGILPAWRAVYSIGFVLDILSMAPLSFRIEAADARSSVSENQEMDLVVLGAVPCNGSSASERFIIGMSGNDED